MKYIYLFALLASVQGVNLSIEKRQINEPMENEKEVVALTDGNTNDDRKAFALEQEHNQVI